MQTRIKKTTKKLLLIVIVATMLCTVAVSTSANYTEYRSSDQYGNTYWLSCGSSAGDCFFKCPAGGGLCEDQGSDGAHQACVDAGYYIQ